MKDFHCPLKYYASSAKYFSNINYVSEKFTALAVLSINLFCINLFCNVFLRSSNGVTVIDVLSHTGITTLEIEESLHRSNNTGRVV